MGDALPMSSSVGGGGGGGGGGGAVASDDDDDDQLRYSLWASLELVEKERALELMAELVPKEQQSRHDLLAQCFDGTARRSPSPLVHSN